MKFKLALAALLLGVCTHAFAQADYPAQPVRLIVPSGAGGITDVLARILAEKLGPVLKQSVFVENKTGASGIVGSDFVAHSRPDGYTLLMAFPSHVANPSINKNLPYDTVKDFAPITKVGSVVEVLLVDKNSPITSVKGLIEAAKAPPSPYTYGTVGTGSLGDLATLIFENKAKLRLLHVPYKSEPEIVTALIRGDLQFAFSSPPGALPMLNAGRIRALAVSDSTRSPIFPDLPTIAESGLPDYNVTGWNAIFAPGSAEWLPYMEEHGIRGWARHTMGPRLGPVAPRCVDWWVDMMGATAMSTAKAYLKWVGTVEPAKDLPHIKAPTLAIMTESSNLDNVAGQVDHNVMRQGKPDAELLILKMDCYHPAGAHPDLCAAKALEFMAKHA